jgi:hypothetical protein
MLLYFVPESTQIEDLESLGLRHIYEDPSNLVRVPIFGGPHGFGCVFGSKESLPESRIGYCPAQQEIQNFGRLAIGKYKDSKFDPESLLRSSPLSFHTWKDVNGMTWKIPIARKWTERGGNMACSCSLPQYLSISETGEWVYGGVLERYSQLWDVASQYYSSRSEAIRVANPGETYTFNVPDFDDICSAVFGANYRVGKYELAFLKALVPDSFSQVLSLVVDDPGFEELSQKKTV